MTTLVLSKHEIFIQYIKIFLMILFSIAGFYFFYKSISFYNHFEQVYNQCVQNGQSQPNI